MTTVCQKDKKFENPIPAHTNQAMDGLKMAHCIIVTHGEEERVRSGGALIDSLDTPREGPIVKLPYTWDDKKEHSGYAGSVIGFHNGYLLPSFRIFHQPLLSASPQTEHF